MAIRSIPQIWDRVEALVTIRLVANENDGHVLVDVDPGDLPLDHVVSLSIQALADRMVNVITPSPSPVGLCPTCCVAPVKRTSADGEYSVWVCPDCRQLVTGPVDLTERVAIVI